MNDETKDILGLFINLDSDEELNFESKAATTVIFVKETEARSLGMHKRQEVPISICQAMVYVTSERLLLLVLHQLPAGTLAELKTASTSRISKVTGVWFEIPLSAISVVDTRLLKPLPSKEMRKFFEFIFPRRTSLDEFLNSPAIEVVYDEQAAAGGYRDHIQSLLSTGAVSRVFTRVQSVLDKIIILGDEIVSIVPSLKTTTRRIRHRPPSRLSKYGED